MLLHIQNPSSQTERIDRENHNPSSLKRPKRRFTVTRQVQLGMGLIMFLLLLMWIFTFFQTKKSESLAHAIHERSIPQLVAINEAKDNLSEFRVRLLYDLLNQTSSAQETKYLVNMEEQLKKQKKVSQDQQVKKKVDEVLAMAQEYRRQLGNLSRTADPGEKKKILQAMASTAESMLQAEDELQKITNAKVDTRVSEMKNTAQSAVALVTAVGLVGIIIGLVIALLSSRNLTVVARRLQGVSSEVANGAEEFSAASEEMSSSSEQVESAVEEINKAIEQVSAGNEQSSSAVQQVTQSITESSQAISRLAEKAQEISDTARKMFTQLQTMGTEMQDGRRVLDEALEAINELEGRIQKVNNISGTIMQITDQTNLLALNAAIEAARAGEHGLGFAVVADEVKKLAEESKAATQNIQQILTAASEAFQRVIQVLTGRDTLLSSQGDQGHKSILAVFGAMESSVQKAIEAMRTVMAASEEQAAASEETNASAQEISAAAEEVAAQVEETTAAAEEMATNIRQIVSAVQQLAASANQMAKSSMHQAELAQELMEENQKLV